MRYFAIGDIHGHYRELDILYRYLVKNQNLNEDDTLVFLGDYIDRGPQSSKVLDFMADLQKNRPNTIFLKGNHEDMFLNFLGQEGRYGEWSVANGSRILFKEYGLEDFIKESMDLGARTLVPKEQLWDMIPEAHRNFLTTLSSVAIADKYIFVHAGLCPWTSLEEQRDEDYFWIRDGFLRTPHKFGKVIVHGHTITKEAYYVEPYEINIDTGCFLSKEDGDQIDGKLSCLKIENDEFSLYSIKNGKKRVKQEKLIYKEVRNPKPPIGTPL